jgi:hypothetical protein
MLLSQAEWARRAGFSRQYANKLVRRGVVRLVDGRVDPAQAAAALAALRQPARPERRTGGRDVGGRGGEDGNGAGADGVRPEPPRAPLPFPGGGGGIGNGFGAGAADLPTLLLKSRIKSEVERARLLELRARAQAGRLLPADAVEAAAFARARAVRDALLALPDRLAPLLAAEPDPARCHDLLSADIHTVLEDLAGDHPDRDDILDPGRDPGPGRG